MGCCFCYSTAGTHGLLDLACRAPPDTQFPAVSSGPGRQLLGGLALDISRFGPGTSQRWEGISGKMCAKREAATSAPMAEEWLSSAGLGLAR